MPHMMNIGSFCTTYPTAGIRGQELPPKLIIDLLLLLPLIALAFQFPIAL